jgi:YidC/Oxa1 family membrane protein insertase
MEESSNKENQSRFMMAIVLSMLVLFAWTYFFSPTKPPTDDGNVNANANANSATAEVQPTPQTKATTQPAATSPDTTPNRVVTVKSPLYEVTLDSRGALATSWIILKNKSPKEERPVYGDGSSETNKKPLQLISQKALAQDPREVPFRLLTEDAGLNSLVNDRNYQVSEAGDTVELTDGQQKQIDFTLTDAGGVSVVKSFVFRADNYVTDLSIRLTNNGQPVPNTKLLIGASIGDQAIERHNFYHIEPEAIAIVDGSIFRHQGYSFTFDANDRSVLAAPGSVDWAGVGDSYFAMAAVPAERTQGLEFRATKYEHPTESYHDGIIAWITGRVSTSETRHLITAYLPVAADGSVTRVFTGPKDYFALSDTYSTQLTQAAGRSINLVDLINFSNYSWLRFFTKPIGIVILEALSFFNGLTQNYGIAIIAFTFLFYSLLFPLRWSQSKSFKKASGNQPKMKDLQDRIKDLQKKGIPVDDPRMRALQMEQLKMTKDAIPLGGCLPMLLQFPLLIAFYTAVTVSLDIRQASFIWLPDLSAADPFHLLEFAFAISMVLSMKFTPTPSAGTPEQLAQQRMQQKMMTYFMPIMMLWVMWSAPSGLLLYWFFGNIVSFGQQMVINRLNKTPTPPATEVVDTIPKSGKKVKPKLSTSQ